MSDLRPSRVCARVWSGCRGLDYLWATWRAVAKDGVESEACLSRELWIVEALRQGRNGGGSVRSKIPHRRADHSNRLTALRMVCVCDDCYDRGKRWLPHVAYR